MKIADIEIGHEYVYDSNWPSSRQRVKALEIVTIPGRSRYERSMRKVRCQVLNWDTGEHTSQTVDRTARNLEPYAEVMERIRAQEARKADHEDRRQRVMKALNMLGVPAGVATTHGGIVVVNLDANGIDALEHAALTD